MAAFMNERHKNAKRIAQYLSKRNKPKRNGQNRCQHQRHRLWSRIVGKLVSHYWIPLFPCLVTPKQSPTAFALLTKSAPRHDHERRFELACSLRMRFASILA